MVSPIGADVDLFLESHHLRTDSFFLDLRMVTRRAVEMLLADEEWSAKSDRWIAETAGVSHSTVAIIKQVVDSTSSTITGDNSPKTGKDH
jgi:hypothetical protein